METTIDELRLRRARSMLLLAGALVASLVITRSAAAQMPADGLTPEVEDLPAAPYATMGMKLERTILKVDVLALTIRTDDVTAARIAEIVRERGEYDDDLEDPIVEAALTPKTAIAEIEFLRGASLQQFLEGVDDDMRRALDAGWLEQASYERIRGNLPAWFEFLGARRIQDGDRLTYEVRGDTLRTTFRGVGVDGGAGAVLLDQTDVGRQNVVALLGAYFAPGSSFRKDLVRSLWRGWDPADP